MMREMRIAVTIAGSYRKHLGALLSARRELLGVGSEVLRPATDAVISDDGPAVRLVGDPHTPAGLVECQLEAIRACDLLYVVNPGGYIGPSAMLEIGYAHAFEIPIFSSEPPCETVAEFCIVRSCRPARAVRCVAESRVLSAVDRRILTEVRSGGCEVTGTRTGKLLTARTEEGQLVVAASGLSATVRPDGSSVGSPLLCLLLSEDDE